MGRLRDIPWLRIAAEGTAIVVGILLAFAIDAWWESRQERVREADMLVEVKREFAATEIYLGSLIDRHRRLLAQLERIEELLAIGADANGEFPGLSDALWQIQPYEPRLPVYENLLASSGLDAISNADLRRALRNYQSAAIFDNEWDDYQKAFDISHAPSMLFATLPMIFEGSTEPAIRKDFWPDVGQLARNLEFLNYLALRTAGERTLIERRTELLRTVQVVVAEIEALE